MPRLNLTHREIANVLTYVYHSWGNSGEVVAADRVTGVLEGGEAPVQGGGTEGESTQGGAAPGDGGH